MNIAKEIRLLIVLIWFDHNSTSFCRIFYVESSRILHSYSTSLFSNSTIELLTLRSEKNSDELFPRNTSRLEIPNESITQIQYYSILSARSRKTNLHFETSYEGTIVYMQKFQNGSREKCI